MTPILLSILFLPCFSRAAVVTYSIPPSAPIGSATIAPAPVGVSFEFGAFPSYFTDVAAAVTNRCLQNLADLTGLWPPIRIGGASQAAYNASSSSYITPSYPMPTGVSAKLQFGPSFMTLASTYKGTVVLGLNRGLADLSNTIAAAEVAKEYMSNLLAIELGNEPDLYLRGKQPIAVESGAWTPAIDADSENDWAIRTGRAISTENIIQAGNFAYQPSIWGAAELIKSENSTAKSYVKDYSHHNYPGGPLNDLMSHSNIVKNIAKYRADCEAAISVGRDYVLGETNSVAGGGAAGVSPTFGAALWTMDYSLKAVSSNIAKSYFHHGYLNSPCYYCWWTTKDIRNPYYGAYIATAAMAGGSHIAALSSGNDDAATATYVIYDAALAQPLRAVLYNSDYYDGTGLRENVTFVITGLNSEQLKAKRLTANSALSTHSNGDIPSFGGQIFEDGTCLIVGDETFENVPVVKGEASFNVGASEALLVYLK